MFSFQGFATGFAEQVQEDIDTRKKRTELIIDKAWDDHTKRYYEKRDKEEAKAEVIEETIKSIASLKGVDGNVDKAASIYNKLGTIENAKDWLQGANNLTNFGSDLVSMGYISNMPDDFKTSDMTVEEYAKSFTKEVKFGKGLTDIPRGSRMGRRVAEGLQRRADEMEAAGLIPESVLKGEPKAPINYADIKVDMSLRGSNVSVDATEQTLTTQLARLDKNSKSYNSVRTALDNLRDAKRAAKGGNFTVEQGELARIRAESMIKTLATRTGKEKTGLDIDTNGEVITTNAILYGKWSSSPEVREQVLNQAKALYGDDPAQIKAFEAYLDTITATHEADEQINENKDKTNTTKEVVGTTVNSVLNSEFLKKAMEQGLNENKTYTQLLDDFKLENPKATEDDLNLFKQLFDEIEKSRPQSKGRNVSR